MNYHKRFVKHRKGGVYRIKEQKGSACIAEPCIGSDKKINVSDIERLATVEERKEWREQKKLLNAL